MNDRMWNPKQYERFKAERELPFYDLLAMIERDAPREGDARGRKRVVDLGCGTGELTGVLHRELGASETLGVDSSAEMLARASKAEGVHFEKHDVATFTPEASFDVVCSNAALQWVDDHRRLFARLTEYVAPDGQFAVQMPANFDYPTHVVATEIAREAPFSDAGTSPFRTDFPLLAPEEYAQLLHDLGYTKQTVRLQVYAHLLPSRDEVVEWVKGSLLTAYRARLSPELYEQFLARYTERLLPQLPDAQPFFFPFKRILIWGRR